MEEKKVMLKNLEDTMAEMRETLDAEPSKVEMSEECFSVTDGIYAEIPDIGLAVESGVVYQLYEDGEYYPDWDVTFVFRIGDNPQNYLYYEQDGIVTTLHNYLSNDGMSGYLRGRLECIIKEETDGADN